jgi:hypothetical protein
VTADDLLAAVGPVASCLDRLHVRFFLTGSAASSAHGIARASLDVDLVAELDPAHVDPFIACLADAYYVPADTLRAAVAQRRSFNLIHLASMFKVDVFVSRRRDYDLLAADRAQPATLPEAGSRPLPTATPEDTILRKLEWFRRGGEVSERQWWDVVGVLRVTRHADREYLRAWAARLGVADLLDRALTQADAEETDPPRSER